MAILKDEIPKCPICLGFYSNPIKPKNCPHIFCQVCLFMWLQKKENCPICRQKIIDTSLLYFPLSSKNKNEKLKILFNSIENVKISNYGKFSKNCLICGLEEPKEQLITCDICNYFQSHFLCDPPLGLAYGKFYCRFCRNKFLESIKNTK